MSLFDSITGQLGNLDELASKMGISTDQVQSLTQSLQEKLQDGGSDKLAALQSVAEEHGLSAESIQGLISHLGGEGGLEGLAAKFGINSEEGIGGLLGSAKNLFGG